MADYNCNKCGVKLLYSEVKLLPIGINKEYGIMEHKVLCKKCYAESNNNKNN